ncbi:hypothetical protein QBC42DRAFT_103290 [Cladorrhinum samala]|uniref:Uncharacterized protein n=1 Tax=Cladorrhinum samala TaxID=585594 RepID=A0AAV9I238_9PEZI|nr:hypothetical protein QBC42DRAFT_103290 [Cladorrhinum samala]
MAGLWIIFFGGLLNLPLICKSLGAYSVAVRIYDRPAGTRTFPRVGSVGGLLGRDFTSLVGGHIASTGHNILVFVIHAQSMYMERLAADSMLFSPRINGTARCVGKARRLRRKFAALRVLQSFKDWTGSVTSEKYIYIYIYFYGI